MLYSKQPTAFNGADVRFSIHPNPVPAMETVTEEVPTYDPETGEQSGTTTRTTQQPVLDDDGNQRYSHATMIARFAVVDQTGAAMQERYTITLDDIERDDRDALVMILGKYRATAVAKIAAELDADFYATPGEAKEAGAIKEG